MDELIRKKDALDALMAERKHLLDKGRWGAEHVLTHHGYNVIDELPTANDKLIQIIEEGIKATGTADEYSVGMCNGMKWCKSLLDGKAPEYDIVHPKHKKRRR